MKNRLLKLLLVFAAVIILLAGCRPQTGNQPQQTGRPQSVQQSEQSEQQPSQGQQTSPKKTDAAVDVKEDGHYTSKEEVAAYIHKFGKLPDNFITKTQAKKRGWDQNQGNLQEVLGDMSIGGGPFNNYEGQLPEAPGRQYYECDINYHGGKRGAERIIYSNDGLIYYTGDHYNTFERLY